MKLLIDANLSYRVATIIREAGYESSHVVDHDLWNASDQVISETAVRLGAVVISADSDFAQLLALSGISAPSLVLLRSPDALSPEKQAELLLKNLPIVVDDLRQGSVVSLSVNHLRIRRLPLG